MMQMHVPAFRFSVNPLPTCPAWHDCAAWPTCGQGLLPAALKIADRNGAGRRFLDAVGRATAIHSGVDPGAGGAHRRGHHHHRHGPGAAFGDTSGGFRKLIQIVFGLSIAFAASSFFLSFFSFSGGAVV